MRCRRCHSKIDDNKKMCPVCGTLVRKPRGSMKIAPEAGGTRAGMAISEMRRRFADVNFKLILAILCGAALAATAAVTFNCSDCASCDNTGGFSSCSLSLDDCRSCSCGSHSEAVTASAEPDTAAEADTPEDDSATEATVPTAKEATAKVKKPKKKASCAGSNEAVHTASLNSTPSGREFYSEGILYYADSNGIYSINDNNETELIITGSGISSLCECDGSLYYLTAGNLWRVNLDTRSVAMVIDASSSGSDVGISRIYGYDICGSRLCFWGADNEGKTTICVRELDDSRVQSLRSCAMAQVQVYRDYVYYLSREEYDFNVLYAVDLTGGKPQPVCEVPVTYYAACDGNIIAYTWSDNTAGLLRISLEDYSVLDQWGFIPIRGMMANDKYVYYYCNDADGAGYICRIRPDGTENTELFRDYSYITLNHVAGSCISLYTSIDNDAEDKYANARYYIINTETREKLLVY